MALIVGIVAVVVIGVLIVLFYLANGTRTRGEVLPGSSARVMRERRKKQERASGID